MPFISIKNETHNALIKRVVELARAQMILIGMENIEARARTMNNLEMDWSWNYVKAAAAI